MDKHTFKVGDRIVALGDKGYIAKPHDSVRSGQWLIMRDDRHSGSYDPYYVYPTSVIKHDTDFQVGDWVRYEGITEYALKEVEGCVGQAMAATHDSMRVDFPNYATKGAHWCIENLVKIQPPSVEFNDCIVHDYPPHKDSDDTIIHVFTSYTNKEEKNMRNVFNITHEKYGVVQGVHQVAPGCYCKDGAYYYHGEGWRETEEWVTIQVRRLPWDRLYKDDGYLLAYGTDNSRRTIVRWRYPQ